MIAPLVFEKMAFEFKTTECARLHSTDFLTLFRECVVWQAFCIKNKSLVMKFSIKKFIYKILIARAVFQKMALEFQTIEFACLHSASFLAFISRMRPLTRLLKTNCYY